MENSRNHDTSLTHCEQTIVPAMVLSSNPTSDYEKQLCKSQSLALQMFVYSPAVVSGFVYALDAAFRSFVLSRQRKPPTLKGVQHLLPDFLRLTFAEFRRQMSGNMMELLLDYGSGIPVSSTWTGQEDLKQFFVSMEKLEDFEKYLERNKATTSEGQKKADNVGWWPKGRLNATVSHGTHNYDDATFFRGNVPVAVYTALAFIVHDTLLNPCLRVLGAKGGGKEVQAGIQAECERSEEHGFVFFHSENEVNLLVTKYMHSTKEGKTPIGFNGQIFDAMKCNVRVRLTCFSHNFEDDELPEGVKTMYETYKESDDDPKFLVMPFTSFVVLLYSECCPLGSDSKHTEVCFSDEFIRRVKTVFTEFVDNAGPIDGEKSNTTKKKTWDASVLNGPRPLDWFHDALSPAVKSLEARMSVNSDKDAVPRTIAKKIIGVFYVRKNNSLVYDEKEKEKKEKDEKKEKKKEKKASKTSTQTEEELDEKEDAKLQSKRKPEHHDDNIRIGTLGYFPVKEVMAGDSKARLLELFPDPEDMAKIANLKRGGHPLLEILLNDVLADSGLKMKWKEFRSDKKYKLEFQDLLFEGFLIMTQYWKLALERDQSIQHWFGGRHVEEMSESESEGGDDNGNSDEDENKDESKGKSIGRNKKQKK